MKLCKIINLGNCDLVRLQTVSCPNKLYFHLQLVLPTLCTTFSNNFIMIFLSLLSHSDSGGKVIYSKESKCPKERQQLLQYIWAFYFGENFRTDFSHAYLLRWSSCEQIRHNTVTVLLKGIWLMSPFYHAVTRPRYDIKSNVSMVWPFACLMSMAKGLKWFLVLLGNRLLVQCWENYGT